MSAPKLFAVLDLFKTTDHGTLPLNHRAALVILAGYEHHCGESCPADCKRDGLAWPSRASLAQSMGCTIEHAQDILRDLRKHGWVMAMPRATSNGAQTSNYYAVRLDGKPIRTPKPLHGAQPGEDPCHAVTPGVVDAPPGGETTPVGVVDAPPAGVVPGHPPGVVDAPPNLTSGSDSGCDKGSGTERVSMHGAGEPPVVKLAPRAVHATDGPKYLDMAKRIVAAAKDCAVARALMAHAKAHDGKVLEVYLTRKRREVLDDYQAGLEDPYDRPSDTEEPAPIRHKDSDVLTVHVPTTLATVGRTPPSIVEIPDSAHSVSGKHLNVETRDGVLWVRDVSRNGSYFAATREPLPKDQWTAVPTGTVLILADNQNGVHVKLVPQAQATGTHDHPF